jgi:hypothetical protein
VRQLLLKKHVVPFTVFLSIFYFSSCEKKFDSIIDPNQNAPIIIDASSSITVINTDTINIGDERKPDDQLTIRGVASIRVFHPQGKKEISEVKYSISVDQSSSIIGEGVLNDDGILPDRIANDSIYSGYIQFQIPRVLVGKLTLSLWSENYAGQLSNTALLPISVIRLNHAPVISDLIAPSTINLATDTSFNISIKVIDPDGQKDIKSVSRYTPSGKVLPLSPYNDSIYVETVTLIPPPALGTYLFRFRAVDRSSDSSNVLTQTIVIKNEAITN